MIVTVNQCTNVTITSDILTNFATYDTVVLSGYGDTDITIVLGDITAGTITLDKLADGVYKPVLTGTVTSPASVTTDTGYYFTFCDQIENLYDYVQIAEDCEAISLYYLLGKGVPCTYDAALVLYDTLVNKLSIKNKCGSC